MLHLTGLTYLKMVSGHHFLLVLVVEDWTVDFMGLRFESSQLQFNFAFHTISDLEHDHSLTQLVLSPP